ncbi:bifunctional adenosylcobinamide kinase/adenosylcobinamide-phosphate guanylyltransferase [Paracoccus saliphilus]|uniref:Bifunctional adenosylcobalamin biosynthesis protein n=1 Tax=Paracoccus saliphilus TaxID=405559 RepID=A0AA45W4F9_9RHOB|nr:bifunctional adenosylcobinamide kinase/adenosylcobinamide-phosphate guanylyltransferase [Paracoccus saliphilus]WCR04086.1 bifunctional adenosylcobinamide kinase/adenosylcobinamide-phosphate guanylyltransferase [Paracoccus saliphilus]SIS84756.1 adenosylcobinamide kinase /adenosylcobinamide-phosphate guanylyltransferase [Paracoccus saliphilus]
MTKQGHITLVTGGARSGKSALAERLVARHDLPWIYIATAESRDGEMEERILQHQQRRGERWNTIEEPVALDRALRDSDGRGVRLVDCLTLWLANCGESADIEALILTLRQQCTPVVLVTNELGLGVVPDNAMARRFRDQHGWMNQAVAEVADEVWMSVSGQPLQLKPAREDIDALI